MLDLRNYEEGRLHLKLLDSQIEAIKASSSRSRSSWMFSMLCSAIVAVVIFNTSKSNNIDYTKTIKNEMSGISDKNLVGKISKRFNDSIFDMIICDYGGYLDHPITKTGAILKKISKAMVEHQQRPETKIIQGKTIKINHLEMPKEMKYDECLLENQKNYSVLINYIKYAEKSKKNNYNNIDMTVAADMVKLKLAPYINREKDLYTVNIPIIGSIIIATDIGYVAGVGLTLVGFWMSMSLRRESHSFLPFIRKERAGFIQNRYILSDKYTLEESCYAYSSICDHMLFNTSTGSILPQTLFCLSLFIPPAITILNVIETFPSEDMFITHNYFYFMYTERFSLEALCALSVIAAWTYAIIFEIECAKSVRNWRLSLDYYAERHKVYNQDI